MSQAVGVRVVRRLSAELDGEREKVCAVFPELERELVSDLNRSVARKDYVGAARHANELAFLAQVTHEVCVRRRPGRKERPPFVAHGR